MKDDSKNLYIIGGVTAVLSGLLMIFLSYWFMFQPIETHPIMHGISVVLLIFIVPAVIATTVLLIKDVKLGALLGVGLAALWIGLELIAHCSQTAPLQKINDLFPVAESESSETAIKWVWQAWAEALTYIAGFLYALSAICLGLSLRSWGNSASGYLLIISALMFGITFIPGVSFYWHILSRGVAFIFLGGVLLLATQGMADPEWDE